MNIYISDVLTGLAFVISVLLISISFLSYFRARVRGLLYPAFLSVMIFIFSLLHLAYSYNSTSPPSEIILLFSIIEFATVCTLCGHWIIRSFVWREGK